MFNVGDRVRVVGNNPFQGDFGTIRAVTNSPLPYEVEVEGYVPSEEVQLFLLISGAAGVPFAEVELENA